MLQAPSPQGQNHPGTTILASSELLSALPPPHSMLGPAEEVMLRARWDGRLDESAFGTGSFRKDQMSLSNQDLAHFLENDSYHRVPSLLSL